MAKRKPTADSTRPGPAPWRTIRRWWPRPWAWAYWGVTFWCGLVLLRFAPGLDVLVLPLAFVASMVLTGTAYLIYQDVIARLLARLRRPISVPPPPPLAKPDLAYLVPPRPAYPAIELMRGQCGWVRLRLRVDTSGRVRAYRVIEQAPGRVFEAAVLRALYSARFPRGAVGEASSLFVFKSPGPDAPPWAETDTPHARVVG